LVVVARGLYLARHLFTLCKELIMRQKFGNFASGITALQEHHQM